MSVHLVHLTVAIRKYLNRNNVFIKKNWDISSNVMVYIMCRETNERHVSLHTCSNSFVRCSLCPCDGKYFLLSFRDTVGRM